MRFPSPCGRQLGRIAKLHGEAARRVRHRDVPNAGAPKGRMRVRAKPRTARYHEAPPVPSPQPLSRRERGFEKLQSRCAPGLFNGVTQLWLSKPAAVNAACTFGAAACAASAVSYHANTLGPAPEMLAPIAPACSAACLA